MVTRLLLVIGVACTVALTTLWPTPAEAAYDCYGTRNYRKGDRCVYPVSCIRMGAGVPNRFTASIQCRAPARGPCPEMRICRSNPQSSAEAREICRTSKCNIEPRYIEDVPGRN